jgi:RNA polymerase sigma-70 factor (ECF subfamily)
MNSALSNTMRALTAQHPSATDELIDRLRDGETSAVGEAYDLHHEAVRAFATRLVGDETIAEDLVHEVFVSLPKVVNRFREDSSLRSFLTGIAINHARHYVRSASRRRAAAARMVEQAPRPTPVETPEQATDNRRFLIALARALDTLPLEQRVTFVLCDVEERTAGEASTLTGVPDATVRTRLFHARRKLRDVLEREGFQ